MKTSPLPKELTMNLHLQNEKIKCLEKRAQNMRDFLIHISHEIRTPLNILVGFSELLQKDLLTPEEKKTAISSLFHHSQMLHQLINNFLDLSQIETNNQELTYEATDMQSFLQNIQFLFKTSIERKKISFQIIQESPLPKKLYLNPIGVKQILINLIGNSLKFTQNGFIRLHLSWSWKGGDNSNPPTTNPDDNEGFLKFSVQDSGCGIPKERISKLFNHSQAPQDSQAAHAPQTPTAHAPQAPQTAHIPPFPSSLAPSTNHNHLDSEWTGSGLGLAFCKKLAHKMRGDIQLKHSRPFKENRFDFEIPSKALEKESMTVLPSLGVEAPSTLQKEELYVFSSPLSLLLVEDSIDNQKLFQVLLNKMGVQIDACTNGKRALQKVLQHKNKYDMILMDIELPDMKGTQVTQQLRKEGYTKPIVALTAHAFKETQESITSFGFNSCLTKPIRLQQLTQTLRAHTSL